MRPRLVLAVVLVIAIAILGGSARGDLEDTFFPREAAAPGGSGNLSEAKPHKTTPPEPRPDVYFRALPGPPARDSYVWKPVYGKKAREISKQQQAEERERIGLKPSEAALAKRVLLADAGFKKLVKRAGTKYRLYEFVPWTNVGQTALIGAGITVDLAKPVRNLDFRFANIASANNARTYRDSPQRGYIHRVKQLIVMVDLSRKRVVRLMPGTGSEATPLDLKTGRPIQQKAPKGVGR